MSGVAATPEPASVPLPSGGDTVYHTPYSNNMFAESAPNTVRPTPSCNAPPMSGIFSTGRTTRSRAKLNPFRDEIEDMETPKPLQSKRGGKYHPGQHPGETPAPRDASPESIVHHSPQPSSGTESDIGSGHHSQSEEVYHEGEDEEGSDDSEEEEQVMRLPLETPTSRRLKGFQSIGRRTTGRPSPGRTPAKMLLGYENDFTANFNLDYDNQTTPRPSDFENSSMPPSMFADIERAPFLSQASPYKLNSMPGIAGNPFLTETPKLMPARKPSAFMKNLETPGYSLDAYLNFSPEKHTREMPEEVQLTVKKKRRSPTKNNAASVVKTRTASRNFKSSPSQKYGGAMLEEIIGPTVTAEEKKAAKRRRETQEFREFSAIDLEQLKRYLPEPVLETEEVEESIEDMEEVEHTSPGVNASNVVTAEPIQTFAIEAAGVEAEDSSEETAVAEEEINTVNPPIEVPPTPTRAQRARVRRAGSCPPRPQEAVIGITVDFLKPKPSAVPEIDPEVVIQLQNRVAQLEDEIAMKDVLLEKTENTVKAERRARVAAQQTCEFLELERKFGVCCRHAPGHKSHEEKLGAAAIRLPGSPSESVISQHTRAGSRMGDRPGSSLSNRAPSRLGPAAGRPTRIAQKGGAMGFAAKAATTVAAAVGKKRVREEAIGNLVGRKPQVPRQDKRVLSAGMAATAAAKPAVANGLAKKPEKVAGIARMAANRNVSGGPAVKGALARGARR